VSTEQTKPETEESVEYLRRAAESRLASDRKLSVNERLAALHDLCKQVASIDGAAKRT